MQAAAVLVLLIGIASAWAKSQEICPDSSVPHGWVIVDIVIRNDDEKTL